MGANHHDRTLVLTERRQRMQPVVHTQQILFTYQIETHQKDGVITHKEGMCIVIDLLTSEIPTHKLDGILIPASNLDTIGGHIVQWILLAFSSFATLFAHLEAPQERGLAHVTVTEEHQLHLHKGTRALAQLTQVRVQCFESLLESGTWHRGERIVVQHQRLEAVRELHGQVVHQIVGEDELCEMCRVLDRGVQRDQLVVLQVERDHGLETGERCDTRQLIEGEIDDDRRRKLVKHLVGERLETVVVQAERLQVRQR
mmetsp:Transcript_4649/g.11541  ORF Transcript_4649/g.11541 Transcript_4649/m.11541 type:complete len:257 (-) Transcript_4649:1212-1982(-)